MAMSQLSRSESIRRPTTAVAEDSSMFSRRRRDAMLMALASFFAVLHRRATGEPWQIILGEATVATVCFALASIVMFWKPMQSKLSPITRQRLGFGLACAALTVPTLSRYIMFACGGNGAAWEMVMLTTLGLGAATLAFCGREVKHSALSVVCSGFLTLFATAISDHSSALYIAIFWAIVCLYWLVANHWDRLEVHMAQTVRRERTLKLGTTTLGVAFGLLGAFAVWGREPATRLIQWGIMPTSGGQRWNDPSARSGVGDGDAVVAAKEHAASFGPVESELFLQSDLPSLFDMFDDTLGEISLKRRSEKAMALPNQTPVGEEQKFAQSQKGNAAFSIAREPAKEQRKLKDKNTPAALHWIGPTGVSLALERFNHFDGLEWSQLQMPAPESSDMRRRLVRQELESGVWFFREQSLSPSTLEHAVRSDAVKFINLESARIPTLATTCGVHIADVDREDFFEVTADDCWSMPGRQSIPAMTVIRLVTREIDGDAVNNAAFPAVQQPVDAKTKGIELATELANRWTEGKPRGWASVRAIIERLRTEFTFDRSIKRDDDDPLYDFLTRKVGGDHLFATAAVVMLQSQDYPARLATGFYADPQDLDSFAGHTEIGTDDAHVWAEVLAADQVWIPIEPTPGFLEPALYQTIWSRMAQFAWLALPWTLAASLLSYVLWLTRTLWGEVVCQAIWSLSRPLGEQIRLKILVRLLDIRSRLAGLRRPAGITPRRWFLTSANQVDEATTSATQRFFDGADLLCYAPHQLPPRDWIADAHRVARHLTIKQIHRSQVALSSLQTNRKLGSA
jgi:protein-glutamine gamma-glutamyltransferase